ncbi:MAG: PadR family transcriptional regulator [Candidatus Bathyarchaeia archaeon]
MAKTRALIPRGFSRFYILHLLREKGPMTGKEIIDEAERRSEGLWRPSPGLVYPLLGRLLSDELIEETEGGRYTLTGKGAEVLKEFARVQEEIGKRVEVVRKLGFSGKMLAEDALDRLMAMASDQRKYISQMSAETKSALLKKYKAFLESELKKLEET